jgi:hypothetical protein
MDSFLYINVIIKNLLAPGTIVLLAAKPRQAPISDVSLQRFRYSSSTLESG